MVERTQDLKSENQRASPNSTTNRLQASHIFSEIEFSYLLKGEGTVLKGEKQCLLHKRFCENSTGMFVFSKV